MNLSLSHPLVNCTSFLNFFLLLVKMDRLPHFISGLSVNAVQSKTKYTKVYTTESLCSTLYKNTALYISEVISPRKESVYFIQEKKKAKNRKNALHSVYNVVKLETC